MASKVVTDQRVETTNGIVNGHMHFARHAGGKFAERPRPVRSLGLSYAAQIACLFGLMVSVNMVLNTRKLPLRRGLASYDSPL
jgi:nitrate/nitrite transporter NarK